MMTPITTREVTFMRANDSEKVRAALKKIADHHCLDLIYETYEAKDYVEIHGRTAGDLLTFRVYDNGTVVER